MAGALVAVTGFWTGAPTDSFAAEPATLPQVLQSTSQLQWRTPAQPPAATLRPQAAAPSAQPQIVYPASAIPSEANSARIILTAGEEPVPQEVEILRPVANLAPIQPIADEGQTAAGTLAQAPAAPEGAAPPMLAPPLRTPPMRLAPAAGQPTPATPLELPPAGPSLAPPEDAPRVAPPALPMATQPPMAVPMTAPDDAVPPGLEPVDPLPGIRPAQATPFNGAGQGKKPCAQLYNGRDICDEDGQCARAWNELQGKSIRHISLDLTPAFDPTAASRTESDRKRNDELSVNYPRAWYFASGEPVFKRLDRNGQPILNEQNEYVPEFGQLVEDRGDQLVLREYRGAVGGDAARTVTVALDQLSLDNQHLVRGRPWKNRHGQLVAQGRFIDFVAGEVHVKQPDGKVIGVPFRSLAADEVAFVSAYWRIPLDCRFSDENYREIALDDAVRFQHSVTMTWKASALCHKPLWFEDVNLERYGHTRGPFLQPLASCAHFFGNICLLPYNMGMDPPGECQYALGYYRPGSCAPWMINAFPLSPRGALAEAGVVVGIGFMVP